MTIVLYLEEFQIPREAARLLAEFARHCGINLDPPISMNDTLKKLMPGRLVQTAWSNGFSDCTSRILRLAAPVRQRFAEIPQAASRAGWFAVGDDEDAVRRVPDQGALLGA